MKNLILLFTLLFAFSTQAQDTIFSAKFPPVVGEVLEVNSKRILVHLPGTPKGDLYSMKKKQITKIYYAQDSTMTYFSPDLKIEGLKKVTNNWQKKSVGVELFAPLLGLTYTQDIYKNYLSLSLNLSTSIRNHTYENYGNYFDNSIWRLHRGVIRIPENKNFQTFSINGNRTNYNAVDLYQFNMLSSQFGFRLKAHLLNPRFSLRPYMAAGLGVGTVNYIHLTINYQYLNSENGADIYRVQSKYEKLNTSGYTREIEFGLSWAISPKLSCNIGYKYFNALFKAKSSVIEGTDKSRTYVAVGNEIKGNIGYGFFIPVGIQFSL
jgi:hypothetical protein